MPNIIASYFTLAGQAVPFEGSEREVSPHDFADRAHAAAAAGFVGLGVSYPDLRSITKRMTFDDIRAILDERGLTHLELECVVDWHADGSRLDRSNSVRRLLLECAGAIGACHIKVAADQAGEEWPRETMIRRFRDLCKDAAAAGTAIVLEPMPWSNVNDVVDAARLVADAQCDNGGLLLDVWHVSRAGTDFAVIKSLPKETIGYVELCDALSRPVGSLQEDTINNRRLCGEGELDVPLFIESVRATGYDGDWGVEVISHAQRSRRPDLAARLAFDSAVSLL